MAMTTPPPAGSLPAGGTAPDMAADSASGMLAGTGTAHAGVRVAPARPRGLLRRGFEVFAENKPALAGLGVMAFMILFCFVGPLVYRTDQVHTNLNDVLCTPSARHLLGCDDVGYDVLGRLMIGGQTSLEVGVAAAFVSVLFGTLYGAISGFLGGIADAVMMRIVDAGLSLPPIVVTIILSVIFHPSPLVMIFIIAVFYWLSVARLIRGETLALRSREYVQSVRVLGGGKRRAIVRHILPNAIGTIIVQATFAIADSILLLSALGFLGLGVQAPATDWGSMLSGGLNYLQSSQSYWWLIYPPGVAIILVCISFNFIGDALRDAFETRLQRR
jgi:peptide/nickel transport system permease protein